MWLSRRVLMTWQRVPPVLVWLHLSLHRHLYSFYMDDTWGVCIFIHQRVTPHSGTPSAVNLMYFLIFRHWCSVLFAYFWRSIGFKNLVLMTWNMLIASWDIVWMSKLSHLYRPAFVPLLLPLCLLHGNFYRHKKKEKKPKHKSKKTASDARL